jgi:glycosyltransferase involved in cell wall biosynthesis
MAHSGVPPAEPGSSASRLEAKLILIDDILPTTFSPFRTLEYRHYLQRFDALLLSSERWAPWVPWGDFDYHWARFPIEEELRPRIRRLAGNSGISARLAYVTFLSNASRHLQLFEEQGIPFILQLYPGGAFEINQPHSDSALRRVLHSKLCLKVITTQTLTRDYVIETIGCDPGKVGFIYGGVFPQSADFDFDRDKRFYPRDKATLDLCFVAHKYKENITSKGYDTFVEIARALAESYPQARFHVVGGYTAEDVPLGAAAEVFTFYGVRESAFFSEFYPGMDIIISINRPFDLLPGAFDGFPTGGCKEAGFRGVLNCINDPLGLNHHFTPERDLILLDFDLQRSLSLLRGLLDEPRRLYDLARNNWRKFQEVFDVDRQLAARRQIIVRELNRLS